MREHPIEPLVRKMLNDFNGAYGRKAPVIDTPEKARATIEVWVENLKDIPAYKLEYAAKKWIQTRKWAPSISEIREMALTEGLPYAENEWDEVCKCFSDRTRYRSLHHITKEAVRMMGGLSAIGMSTEADIRKNFINTFNMCLQRAKTNMMQSAEVFQAGELLRQEALEAERKLLEQDL